jgi:hypothetical protein
MRGLKTLVLAVLLLALGGYVYFFELGKEDKGKSERLLDFKPDEAAGIDLAYPNRALQLQKDSSGKWKLVQPARADADDSTVRSLLGAVAASDIKRPLEKNPSAQDLKSFGLDPPAVKVSITLKNGLTLALLSIGAKTPLGDSAYVRRGNDAGVYLTDGSILLALEKEPNQLRDRTVLVFPRDQVTTLAIETPKQALTLAQREKEKWTLEAPVKSPARADAVNEYLSALARLKAKTFADDQPADLKKYGLDRAALKISLEGKDGKNLAALYVGGKSADGYYVRAEGNSSVYTIDEFSYSTLGKQPADFAAEEKPAVKE